MLVDVLVGAALSLALFAGLTELSLQTVALNHQAALAAVGSTALIDLEGRARLASSMGAPMIEAGPDRCESTQDWLAAWCADTQLLINSAAMGATACALLQTPQLSFEWVAEESIDQSLVQSNGDEQGGPEEQAEHQATIEPSNELLLRASLALPDVSCSANQTTPSVTASMTTPVTTYVVRRRWQSAQSALPSS